MQPLSISDDLKVGKEEILTDPTKQGNKCGASTSPLLLNDLYYQKEDGTFITAKDLILQENISIEQLDVTANGLAVTITWAGTNEVGISIDDSDVVLPNGDREHQVNLTAGVHTILVKALRDRRGLTASLLLDDPDTINTTVTYGVE